MVHRCDSYRSTSIGDMYKFEKFKLGKKFRNDPEYISTHTLVRNLKSRRYNAIKCSEYNKYKNQLNADLKSLAKLLPQHHLKLVGWYRMYVDVCTRCNAAEREKYNYEHKHTHDAKEYKKAIEILLKCQGIQQNLSKLVKSVRRGRDKNYWGVFELTNTFIRLLDTLKYACERGSSSPTGVTGNLW